MASQQPAKEFNFLVIGETGVGKSTWINSLDNINEFKTFDNAKESEFRGLIPSRFMVYDEDGNEVWVETGNSYNENFETGNSATQSSVVHNIHGQDGTIINIIDTPGIGDIRGEDRDRTNMEDILQTISKYNEIHCICILLKPNEERLSVVFRYCLMELLTHLHKTSCQNIVFCFTNCRSTFYRPGNTLASLKTLIKNYQLDIHFDASTIYCFDSEAYRYLGAIKNTAHPVKFGELEEHSFCQSWSRFRNELNRLIKHAQVIRPHDVNSTLSLNNSRQMLEKLTEPLTQICRCIDVNKALIEREKENIQKSDQTVEELKKNLKELRREVRITPVEQPRTVCTNSECSETFNESSESVVYYPRICHDPCYLYGTPTNTVGHHDLMGCWAMKGENKGFCRNEYCGHSYLEHMHVLYVTSLEWIPVNNYRVAEIINANICEKVKKQMLITLKNEEIDDYDKEMKAIEEASVQFASYLLQYSITPYNDAMLEYLDHLIIEERKLISAGTSDERLNGLLLRRESYAKKIEIIEKEMKKVNRLIDPLTPEEVDCLVDRLCKLKLNGYAVRKATNILPVSQYFAREQDVEAIVKFVTGSIKLLSKLFK